MSILGFALVQISAVAIDGIMTSLSNKDYQISCRKHFEAKHPGVNSDAVGNHPNSFFLESYKALKEKVRAYFLPQSIFGNFG